jgi:hypothetical protein
MTMTKDEVAAEMVRAAEALEKAAEMVRELMAKLPKEPATAT